MTKKLRQKSDWDRHGWLPETLPWETLSGGVLPGVGVLEIPGVSTRGQPQRACARNHSTAVRKTLKPAFETAPPSRTASLSHLVVLLLCAWLVLLSVAQNTLAGLHGQVQQIIHAADLRETKVALMAVDLDKGEELASIKPDEPMIPASNMKLITTAAAIQILGLDYVFQTELRLLMPQDWKDWQGDDSASTVAFGQDAGPVLVVAGDGDPGFCDPALLKEHGWDVEKLINEWVTTIRQTGVTKIQCLLVDDRVFDRVFTHSTWPADQLNMWYCAQVSGLNFYDNCVEVYPEPTAKGQSPRVTILPNLPFLNLTIRAITGESDSFWVSRQPQTNNLTFWGTVKHRRTQPVTVTIHDPPMLFGQLLANRLSAVGIEVARVDRPGWDDRLPKGKTLHRVQTTMPVLLRRCNKDSQNLFAEALFKRMGNQVTGTPGSWENGAAAVRFFLQEHLGANGAAVTIADGSGLSQDNRVTPKALTSLLWKIHGNLNIAPAFRESLSIAGSDGTLRKRFKNNNDSQVFAKSGYIKGVSCLTGYLVVPIKSSGPRDQTPPRLRTVAFSLLFNNIKPPVYVHKIKQVQEQLVELFEDWITSESSAMAPTHD